MTSDPYTAQPPPSVPSQPAPPPTAPNLTAYIGPTLGVLGALMIVVGSFLPWATAQTIFGTMSLPGTDGDGRLFLAGGVVLAAGAVLAGVFRRFWLALCQLAAAAGAIVGAAWELTYVTTRLEDQSSEFAVASVGSGLYVLLLGAVVAGVAAAVQLFQHR